MQTIPRQETLAEERRLIGLALDGQPAGVEGIVRLYWRSLHRAAFLILGDTHEAEDVAQEAILRALANLESFEEGRPLGPWLRRIVSNAAVSASRKRSSRPSPVADPELGSGPESAGSDVADAIHRLPLEQREVVVLRHALGFGTEEIAEMLGVPRGTVGSRLRRGLDQLSRQLGGESDG